MGEEADDERDEAEEEAEDVREEDGEEEPINMINIEEPTIQQRRHLLRSQTR